METVNMHVAKTQLSRLVEKAANGEPFVIAKNGRPLVKVTALDAPQLRPIKRLGFMAGQITVPEADVFNTMAQEEIETMFCGEDE